MKILSKRLNYYNQLIEILFKNSFAAVWATNIFGPLGLAYILRGYIDDIYLYSFLAIQFLLGAIRIFIGKKGLKSLTQRNSKKIDRYLKLYLLLIFLNSTLYGVMSVFTIYQADELQVFILLALLFGLLSGSYATLSSVFHALLAYTLPFSLLFTIALLLSGNEVYFLIASMIVIYLLITLPSSYKIYLTLKTNLEKAKIISKQKKELMLNQAQLIQTAKMASMGEMIGNIAHQWRQPLSSISIISSNINLKQELNQDISKEELKKDMNEIFSKTQYLSQTIETFRDFIKEKKELKEIILQERVDLVLQIVESTLENNHIELKLNYKDLDPIIINMVSGELDQVLINIINNAKDILLDKKITNPWIDLKIEKKKTKVLILIEDNAGGIPENIKEKIFDPYFSTKNNKQGTGLGLHMSYKIVVESLKGKIYAKNTKNGAKFFIEIPL